MSALLPGGEAMVTPGGAGIGTASWAALGTYVYLEVADPEQLEHATQCSRDILAEVDAACSRFRSDSDLMRANAVAGQWLPVAPVLLGAVRAALWAAEHTEGLVDPCLGELLVAAGYDRSFAELKSQPDPVSLPTPGPRDAWRGIGLDGERLCVPAGVALDLGATGKAYAADLIAHTLAQELTAPSIVSVGGDVRVALVDGRPAPGWEVVIAPDLAALRDPQTPTCRVQLVEGGLATSSITGRRWLRGGRIWHHVVDPRTGAPTDGTWRSVTAAGPSAVAANAASTAALVLGVEAPDWLAERGIAARLVAADGSIRHTPAWARATGAAA